MMITNKFPFILKIKNNIFVLIIHLVLYNQLAKYYDKVYSSKDYKSESEKIHSLIKKLKKTNGKEMLDVACGTGNHIQYLRKHYSITGIDLEKEMLRVAKKKIQGIKFLQGDMRTFDLNKQFDVIVCLFAAIAHLTNKIQLNKAIRNFSKHLKVGGILLFDAFITPDSFIPNLVHAVYRDEPDLKIYRVNVTKRNGNIAIIDFHVLVADPKGVKYITENHKLAMYEHKDFLDIMEKEGLKSSHKMKDSLITNRGLYIGIKK